MRDLCKPSGETVMATARLFLQFLALFLGALVVAGLAGTARAADAEEELLRRQALALNDVTGDDVIESRIKTLAKDKNAAKKLLAAAKSLAGEKKDSPFNYNATFILARVADDIKDVDAALGFYRISADEAMKLQSGKKLAQAFGGLIDLLYENKRFEEVTKVCKEFVEINGNETVERLKPAVMERMVQSLGHEGKTKEALKITDTLIKAYDGDEGWYFRQLKGWVLREDGQPAESAKVYEDVLTRIENDKTLEKDDRAKYTERARYLLSGIYIEAKDVPKAIAQLETLVKAKPDDPTYNNDLGYILADN
jgi:tetratricopeptide (TPR) repeat protein